MRYVACCNQGHGIVAAGIADPVHQLELPNRFRNVLSMLSIGVALLGRNAILREDVQRVIEDQSFTIVISGCEDITIMQDITGERAPTMIAVADADLHGFDICRQIPQSFSLSRLVALAEDPVFRKTTAAFASGVDPSISGCQIEVPCRLAYGHFARLIAWQVATADAAVKVPSKASLHKLRVMDRTQAAIRAMEHGLDRPAVPIRHMATDCHVSRH